METQARRVLSVYKKILRSGRNWDEQRERDYISSEAKRLFRVNKDLHNQDKIEKKIFEAETRLELALHYHNPYPRPYNLTSKATPEMVQAAPGAYISSAYMDTYFDEGKGDF